MKKLCTYPSCRTVVDVMHDDSPRCSKHQHKKQVQQHQVDESGKYIYHTPRWRRLRLQKLSHEPLCEHCKMEGVYKTADMVDHIKEISDGGEPYDINNLQSLCHKHHSKKTGKERKKRNK